MTDDAPKPTADLEALRAQAHLLAEMAAQEDVGRGDITAALLPPSGHGRFRIVAKEPGVFAGCDVATPVMEAFGGSVELRWLDSGADGRRLDHPPEAVAELSGPIADVLTCERTLLNFLQRLCGIATCTRRYVDAVEGTGALILDTRKTTPGWRHLEKYAVRCGGGRNHRMGLFDAILIKDNHFAPDAAKTAGAAAFEMLNRVQSLDPPPKFIEVEADNLDQVHQLVRVVGVDVILLDNFSPADLRAAVELRDRLNLRGKIRLEASGGVTLDTVAEIARTGVDHISVGAITHSAGALDLSMERLA